jgi:anti-sigma factor RsiW
MRPTRLSTLAVLAAIFALLAYLLAEAAYGELQVLPWFAPVSLLLLAVVELGMAKVVRDRLRGRRGPDGRPKGRPLHPFQVARAAVLAKASSATGAVLFGAYVGLLAYVLPDQERLRNDAVVSAVSALACLALIAAALLLERACRRPTDDEDDLQSTA